MSSKNLNSPPLPVSSTESIDTPKDPPTEPPVIEKKTRFERLYPWLVFIVPMVVYGVVESAAIKFVDTFYPTWEEKKVDLYPAVYAVKLSVTLGAVVFAWLGYPKLRRISLLAIVVGIVGVFVWLGLAWAQNESGINKQLGITVNREGFNPWTSRLMSSPNSIWNFIVIRMVGLAVIVPIMEEMFLRGFVMRFVQHEKWWDVPFGKITQLALIVGMVIPIVTHPFSEFLAVAAWFGMIHWLYYKTGNIWDCVVAHGITNFLLGIYILKYEQWWLW
jgi:CAAX prenyl protease-like protein